METITGTVITASYQFKCTVVGRVLGLCGEIVEVRISIQVLGTQDSLICSLSHVTLSLCDPLDCSPPGSSVHEILQARILKWVAMPLSKGSSWPRDWTYISCVSSTAGGFITTELSLLIGTQEEKLNDVTPIVINQKAYTVLVYKRQCTKMEKSGLRTNLNNLWWVPWCSRIDTGACQ